MPDKLTPQKEILRYSSGGEKSLSRKLSKPITFPGLTVRRQNTEREAGSSDRTL